MKWEKNISPELASFFSKQGAPLDYILDSFTDIVVIENLDFKVVAVNDVVEPILGYKASELIGQPVNRFFKDPAEFEKRKNEDFFNSLNNDAAIFEARYVKKDGSILEAETILKKIQIMRAGRALDCFYLKNL